MTDRPIIFSAPMVRALLEGRKTQTRRVIKPQPVVPFGEIPGFLIDEPAAVMDGFRVVDPGPERRIKLPYAPGDRLWVREGLRMDPAANPANVYLADGERVVWRTRDQAVWLNEYANLKAPGIHMPRWASRLTLLVTDVRVQRLQDISEADARSEGAYVGKATGRVFNDVTGCRLGGDEWRCCRDWFADLWNSINGPDAWDQNPWVAAISFDVVRGNIDQVQP